MAFNPFPGQISPIEITDLPEKTSPIGNDEIEIADSENSNSAKKIKISNSPISSATQTALNAKYDASNPSSYVNAAGATAAAPVQSVASKTGIVTLSKSDVGLSNVDNTSDANKPVSTATQTALDLKIESSIIGQANGVASLDGSGKVPSTQLPSYVDDVLEYTDPSSFPVTGETGKIYVALDNNKCYRWSGSAYVEVSSGEVNSVNGQTGVVSLTKSDIGLGNVDNTSDLNKPISTATQTALDAKQATLVSSTNIKTINGSSVLGSGNLVVSALPAPSSLISALDIDWGAAEVFYKDISANSTFTFSNLVDGKGISVILTNTSGSSITITFPSGIFREAGSITISAGAASVFSFVRANSKTYLASLTNLFNA